MAAMTARTVTDAVFGVITDWSRPLLTYYDDRTGERTELSGATLGNWAAKTANYLIDEIGVVSGDVVRVDLPEHWQTAGILLGAWWAGADIRLGHDDAADEVVTFTGIDGIDDHPDADELVIASLDAFALPLRNLPPGVADYGSVVRVHGDQFASSSQAGPALETATVADVVAQAFSAAEHEGIGPNTRVLSTREWHAPDGVLAHLLGPLVVGASLVHVSGARPDALDARAATEKADLILT